MAQRCEDEKSHFRSLRSHLPHTPLYRRIAGDLRRAIAAGKLPRGARLPSSRALARQLGVSRNSVLAAYEALAAEGLLAGRTGSGTIVRGAPPPRVDGRRILRDAHYPTDAVRLRDPDGNSVYLHR
jgi:DNA-binding FadR family transcriptional regulator